VKSELREMRKGKILIVEDEVIIALDLKKTLKDLGYSLVGTVTSGEEAVKAAGKMHPDLILMDIKLQGHINGLEAGKKIQDKFNIPVIYITAYSDKKTFGLIKKTNSSFFHITKPFINEEICAVVEKVLAKK